MGKHGEQEGMKPMEGLDLEARGRRLQNSIMAGDRSAEEDFACAA
jgi:hypothetical protein